MLGAIALHRMSPGVRRRKHAVAAIVLGIVSLVFFAVLVTFLVFDEINNDDISVNDAQPGQCIADDLGGWEVRLQDCAGPHDLEVFARFEYPSREGAKDPGDEAVGTLSDARCARAFESYVGIPYDDSELAAFPLVPTKETWADGDRTVICVLESTADEPLVGSVKGSGR